MDSKIVKDARLADLVLKTVGVCAKVSDIPGASIVSDNVELEMSKFGDDAEAVFAISDAGEIASISHASGVATIDFTTAVTASSVINVCVKLKL